MIVQPDNHQLRAGLANRRATEVSNYHLFALLGTVVDEVVGPQVSLDVGMSELAADVPP
jgi:hypothetical protein